MKRQTERIKQKKYIFKLICSIFRFESKPSSGAKGRMKMKLKVRYKFENMKIETIDC